MISNLKTQLIQTLTGLITDFTHLSSLLITETNLLVCVVPGSVWWWCCSVHLGWRLGAVEFLSVDTADQHDMGWTQESWSWEKINYHLLVGSLKSLVPLTSLTCIYPPPPSSVGRWWCRPCQAGCIYETTNMKNRSQLSVTAALNRQVCPSVYMLSSVCCYIENLLDSFMFRSRTQRTHAHHSCQKKPFHSLLGCVWVLSLINYKSAFN